MLHQKIVFPLSIGIDLHIWRTNDSLILYLKNDS